MNRSLAVKRKKQVTRGKNLPGTQTPNSFSSHRISWEKKSESCFRHLLKVQLITSYWSGFTSKFHPSREVKKKLHLGRNLLWFFAREQFCHFWRERKRVTREGGTRKMKPRSEKAHLGCESVEVVEQEMGVFILLKVKEEEEDDLMGWSEKQPSGLHVSIIFVKVIICYRNCFWVRNTLNNLDARKIEEWLLRLI